MQSVDNTTVVKPFVDDVHCIGSVLDFGLVDCYDLILKPVFYDAEMSKYRQ